jgi:3-phenylpropionate/cinnamic acid dioxygenase small subunit
MTNDRVADELEIRNVLAEALWLADNAPIDDLDPYLACFTEDAEWEMFGDVRRGHADIRAGAEDRRTSGMMGPGSQVMHFLSCTVVAFEGETTAAVKSYIQAYRNVPNNPEIFLMGRYNDTFSRVDGSWKLAKRVVIFE